MGNNSFPVAPNGIVKPGDRAWRTPGPVGSWEHKCLCDWADNLYALRDPRDGAVRYVGACGEFRSRYLNHLSVARTRPKMPVSLWIRELLDAGLKPQMQLVAAVPYRDLGWAEAQLIAQLRQRGFNLLNSPRAGHYMRAHRPWHNEKCAYQEGEEKPAYRDVFSEV